MKRFLLTVCLAVCASASAANAQEVRTRRTFDNFDTAQGVQHTYVPPAPVVKAAPKVKNKAVKKETAVKNLVQNTALVTPRNNNALQALNKISMFAGDSLEGFSTGDTSVDKLIIESCKRHKIDPLLVYAQMHQESSFRAKAVSYKGARGLMQLMPATAVRFGVTDIFSIKQNIEGGVKYMRWLLDTFNGDVNLALAGYNAGEGAVMKYGWQIPPYRETQEYVRRIGNRYTLLRDPNLARSTRSVTTTQATQIQHKPTISLNIYERSVYAVRMPDGSMQLVSQ